MVAEVKFRLTSQFLGRNGYCKCSGVQLIGDPANVTITPLTSRNELGRCEITIPVEEIPNLIVALKSCVQHQQLMEEIDDREQSAGTDPSDLGRQDRPVDHG